jgi:hypothetical protein
MGSLWRKSGSRIAGTPLERHDLVFLLSEDGVLATETVESRRGWAGFKLARELWVLEDEGRSTLLKVPLVVCAAAAVHISASKSPYVLTLSLLFLPNLR